MKCLFKEIFGVCRRETRSFITVARENNAETEEEVWNDSYKMSVDNIKTFILNQVTFCTGMFLQMSAEYDKNRLLKELG